METTKNKRTDDKDTILTMEQMQESVRKSNEVNYMVSIKKG